MPRTRLTPRKIGLHTAENMLQALLLHRKGASLRKSAAGQGVSYATLRRYIEKYNDVSTEDLSKQRLTPNYNINQVFSEDQEKYLMERIKDCAVKFHGLSTKEIRRIAYEVANMIGAHVPKNWRKEKLAGKEWYRSFRLRNPEFTVPPPEKGKDEAKLDELIENIKEKKWESPDRGGDEVGDPLSAAVTDDAEDEPTSVWNYYEKEAGGRARCVVCRSMVRRQDLKEHLNDNHPKLVAEVAVGSEGDASEQEEEVYTELVYLEDENTTKRTPKPEKKRRISVETPERSEPKKRQVVSYSSDEEPLQKKKSTNDEEIEQFVKYVTCLLKKVPPEACMQLQMEIVNLIMKKQLELKRNETTNKMAVVETAVSSETRVSVSSENDPSSSLNGGSTSLLDLEYPKDK